MPRWIHRLLHNDAADKQLDAELQFHLEQQIADNIADGMAPEEARRRAQIELGGVEQVKQKTRDVHWENWIENLGRDLRFAVRSLNKDRRFALTAIFALALGIAASTVVFSIFYNLLFNAFDTRDASRLVIPMREGFRSGEIPVPLNCSLADIEAIRQQNHVFEDVAGYGTHSGFDLIRDGTRSHQLNGVQVTANAFTFYGVLALIGRGILPEDGKAGALPVFVISYDTWKNEFNSDPKILGKSFIVSEEPRTLIGVMPPRFRAFSAHADLWFPMNNGHSIQGGVMLARLKPGVSLATASAELKVIVQRLEKVHPPDLSNDSEKHFDGRLETTADFLMGPFGLGSFEALLGNPGGFDVKHMLYSLVAGGLLLLLMACINVANLLLARATVREKEIAVRAALGASRGRLVQQLLLERSVLAVAASAIGCVFAYFGTKGANAMIPSGRPPFSLAGGEVVIGLDHTVLLFALGITALTTLVCGLAPAFHATGRNFQPQLSGSGKGVTGDFRHGKLRDSLAIAQVTVSVVLLIGASLLIHSFFRLTHVDLVDKPIVSTKA
jgi:predicted permease